MHEPEKTGAGGDIFQNKTTVLPDRRLADPMRVQDKFLSISERQLFFDAK